MSGTPDALGCENSRGGRTAAFNAAAYADRNVVERCLNRPEQFRALAKRTAYCQAELSIAATTIF